MQKEGLQRNPWSILARSCFPRTDDPKQSRWRSLSCMGRSCRTRSHLQNVRSRILSLQAKLVDLSQKVRKWYPTSEKTFWLQPSVVYIKPFTPRSWRTTTQTHAILEVQTMEIVVEFFLHLVAMKRILVVVNKRGLWSNGATCCLQIFCENLRQIAFTISFYFVTDRSFTADGGLL